MLVVSGPGQDLHDHHIGGVHLGVVLEEAAHHPVCAAPGGSEVLDPRRGVDQRHPSGCRSSRSSSNSASQPAPSMARASSRVIASLTTAQGQIDGGALGGQPVASHGLRHQVVVGLDVRPSHNTCRTQSGVRQCVRAWQLTPLPDGRRPGQMRLPLA